MGLLDSVFARYYDAVMHASEVRGLADARARLLSAVSGDVLEVGAGTGLNLPHYPRALARLTLTEPTPEMAARLRARAARERPDAHVLEAPAEALPLPDASVDWAVSTLVLCTVADVGRAAAELARVLRPGGRLVLFEHVATTGGWGAVQVAAEPLQRFVGRGCHLRRDPRAALQAAGFDVAGLAPTRLPGAPPFIRPALAGVAHRR